VLVAGFAIAAAGLLWLSFTLRGDSYVVDLLPGILLSGYGHGVIYTSMFVIGTHDVPPAHQGTAGALLTTAQYVSGALTVAVLTIVLGERPDYPSFQLAFLITAFAALAGALAMSFGPPAGLHLVRTKRERGTRERNGAAGRQDGAGDRGIAGDRPGDRDPAGR
jgi:MFS family permease